MLRYYFQVFLLMVITRSGLTGRGVTRPVMEELSIALVLVQILRPQTVEKTVVNWEKLQNPGDVTYNGVQVKTLQS